MRVVDLGCGYIKRYGSYRVDIMQETEPDLLQDLTDIPWNISNNSFDMVLCSHVFEHLPDVYPVLKEILRISRNNAGFMFDYPHYTHAYSDPGHMREYGLNILSYFREYKVKTVRLEWISDLRNKSGKIKFVNSVINSVANVRPFFFERFGYIIGGFMNCHLEGVIVKSESIKRRPLHLPFTDIEA